MKTVISLWYTWLWNIRTTKKNLRRLLELAKFAYNGDFVSIMKYFNDKGDPAASAAHCRYGWDMKAEQFGVEFKTSQKTVVQTWRMK